MSTFSSFSSPLFSLTCFGIYVIIAGLFNFGVNIAPFIVYGCMHFTTAKYIYVRNTAQLDTAGVDFIPLDCKTKKNQNQTK